MAKWTDAYVNALYTRNVPRPPFNGQRPAIGVESTKIGHNPTINNQPFSAQTKSIVFPIATWRPDGLIQGEKEIRILVYNPSERLRGSASVVFTNLTTNDAVDPAVSGAPPVWAIRQMAKHPTTGRESALQRVYPSGGGTTPLPDSYEFDTSDKLIRLEIFLNSEQFDATYASDTDVLECNLLLNWEPNTLIGEEERNRLYTLCDVSGGPMLHFLNDT